VVHQGRKAESISPFPYCTEPRGRIQVQCFGRFKPVSGRAATSLSCHPLMPHLHLRLLSQLGSRCFLSNASSSSSCFLAAPSSARLCRCPSSVHRWTRRRCHHLLRLRSRLSAAARGRASGRSSGHLLQIRNTQSESGIIRVRLSAVPAVGQTAGKGAARREGITHTVGAAAGCRARRMLR
jgi:hypothetical protein